MIVEKVKTYACDFCGKHQDQVKALIAGMHNAMICDECVSGCVQIVSDQAGKQPAQDSDPSSGAKSKD